MDVRELYPQEDNYFSVSDYQPMIDAMGDVLVQVDDHDYSGDTRVLLQKDGKIGFLKFGWGSCSYCDALQSCNDFDEVAKLFKSLIDSVMWFDSKEKALEFFNNHDWEGDYDWHSDETKEFVLKCKENLTK